MCDLHLHRHPAPRASREKRASGLRWVLLGLAIPLFALVGTFSYFGAMNPFHNMSYDSREACIVFGGIPQGTVMEEVQDPTTYWPLGFVCEYGKTVVPWQNWPLTIESYSSWLIVAICTVVLLIALLRRRLASPRVFMSSPSLAQDVVGVVGLAVAIAVVLLAAMVVVSFI